MSVILCKLGDQEKSWAHIFCVTCVRVLTGWVNGLCPLLFASSVVWRNKKTTHLIVTFVQQT